MSFKAILATTESNLLGMGGTMPWVGIESVRKAAREDMRFFKEMTTGSNLVMGWNTWLSMGSKPLKDRLTHYVMTSRRNGIEDNVVYCTLDDVLRASESIAEPLWVIGGGMVYNALIPHCTEVYWNTIPYEPEHPVEPMVYLDKEKLLEGFVKSSVSYCPASGLNKETWVNTKMVTRKG